MKGWCKIIETEKYDVLVQRKSDDEAEVVSVTIQTEICEVTQTLGFDENVEKADKVYLEHIDEKYCLDFISAVEKEFLNP